MTVLVGRQLIEGALFSHDALIENEENVAVSDGAQSVGYHDGGASFHCAVKSLLDHLLTVLV